VFEVNFGLTHTPDRTKATMRAYMWGEMKDWLLKGAIESDEKDGDGSCGSGLSHLSEQPAGAGIEG
jgi:hypothetical protein